MENNLEHRLAAQQQRQQDRELGAKLREEARELLHSEIHRFNESLPAGKFASWNQLLDDEEIAPTPNISAGAAVLTMLEVHLVHRARLATKQKTDPTGQ